MTYILENEPMRGFYRLIEYALSGENERARYNIPRAQYNMPLEPRRAAQRAHGDVHLPPPIPSACSRNGYTFRSFKTLKSGQLIESQGVQSTRFNSEILRD